MGLAVKAGYARIVLRAWHVQNLAALVFELRNLLSRRHKLPHHRRETVPES